MSTQTLRRRRTSISMQPQLMNTLRERANRMNTSLSSYIESILLEAVYGEPNEETIAAINESRAGEYAGTVDTSSMEAFRKSMGL